MIPDLGRTFELTRLSKTHINNIQQLMIGILKYLQSLYPPVMNEMFMLANIPYTIKNPRYSIVSWQGPCIEDLNYNLQRTTHCVKSDRMWSSSGPYFTAFGLNTDQNNFEYRHFLHSDYYGKNCLRK